MPQRDLNAKFVMTATAGGKSREFYWDTAQPGFGLMVTDTGARSFIIQYRNSEGVSRRLTINGGKSLAAARREAKKKLGDVAGGGDPLADKQKQRDARQDTLRRIVEDEYLVDSEIKKLRSLGEKKGPARMASGYSRRTAGRRSPGSQNSRRHSTSVCSPRSSRKAIAHASASSPISTNAIPARTISHSTIGGRHTHCARPRVRFSAGAASTGTLQRSVSAISREASSAPTTTTKPSHRSARHSRRWRARSNV